MRVGPGFREPKAWALSLLIVLGVLFAACTYVGVSNAATCTRIAAPANLQDRLNNAGKGANICLSGTFATRTTIHVLAGQTISGGHLKYTGSYRLCEKCVRFTDGFDLDAGNITLRNVEVSGFEGKGVKCGPRSIITESYLHDNRQNGIGCIAQHNDWHIVISHNRINDNGSRILEGYGSGGVKLMEMSHPGHALGAGATIIGNTASNNIGNGLWLDRASNASIVKNNTASGNTRRGFRCEKCGGPILVTGNTFHHNRLEGIDMTDTGVATISDNVTYANGGGGITIRLDNRAKKTYPTLGDSRTGWFVKSIVISGMSKAKDGVKGCPIRNVVCK